MKYQVVLPRRAQRDLDKIEIKHRGKVLESLVILAKDPYVGKKLSGKFKECWSYRVWPYRIIYKILKGELVVLIIRIDQRKGAYR